MLVTAFSPDETLPEEALLEAVRVFTWVSKLEPLRLARGSFYEHLIQYGLEKTLELGSPGRFTELVKVVIQDRTLGGLERFLSETRELGDPTAVDSPHVKRLREQLDVLGLSGELPKLILTCISWSRFESELIVREDDKVQTLKISAGQVAQCLAEAIELRGHEEGFRMVMGQALTRAVQSPFPELWLDRLVKLLKTENLPEKLAEMAIDEGFDREYLHQLLDENEEHAQVADQLDGTIYTGLVWNRDLAMQLAEAYRELRMLNEPSVQIARRDESYRAARDLLGKKPSFTAQDLQRLLMVHSTPYSRSLNQALETREISLKVLDQPGLARLGRASKMGELPPSAKGVFIPADRTVERRAIVAVLGLSEALSAEEASMYAAYLAGHAIHEFVLHGPEPSFARRMRASLQELRYLMEHGVTGVWDEVQSLTPLGLGFHLRNKVDLLHYEYPRPFLGGPLSTG